MFARRLVSTRHHLTPRRLIAALAVTLALGTLPLIAAGQHASSTRVRPPSSDQAPATDAATASSDEAARRSIIFVGGRNQGSADHAMNPQAHPPGPCAPRMGSRSSGGDCSLNPQPIPPGHQAGRTTEDAVAPRTPRRHRPADPHHGG